MSRTIRRTKAKKHYSRFEKDYTWRRLDVWLDVVAGYQYRSNGVPKRPIEGKEGQQIKARYYTDNGLAIFFYEDGYERAQKETEKEYRTKMTREIRKWIHDPDHEIQLRPRETYWEYY